VVLSFFSTCAVFLLFPSRGSPASTTIPPRITPLTDEEHGFVPISTRSFFLLELTASNSFARAISVLPISSIREIRRDMFEVGKTTQEYVRFPSLFSGCAHDHGANRHNHRMHESARRMKDK
jgi:hypothetical protein